MINKLYKFILFNVFLLLLWYLCMYDVMMILICNFKIYFRCKKILLYSNINIFKPNNLEKKHKNEYVIIFNIQKFMKL